MYYCKLSQLFIEWNLAICFKFEGASRGTWEVNRRRKLEYGYHKCPEEVPVPGVAGVTARSGTINRRPGRSSLSNDKQHFTINVHIKCNNYIDTRRGTCSRDWYLRSICHPFFCRGAQKNWIITIISYHCAWMVIGRDNRESRVLVRVLAVRTGADFAIAYALSVHLLCRRLKTFNHYGVRGKWRNSRIFLPILLPIQRYIEVHPLRGGREVLAGCCAGRTGIGFGEKGSWNALQGHRHARLRGQWRSEAALLERWKEEL